ncbi:MAG TPA: hypothetical protein VFG68_07925 [Fimbriiglobus sp.]|nr:hypothetical protein [Fimbriiglobus sp.]
MPRAGTILALLLTAAAASADAPPRFRWTPGQTLTYSVQQTTTVTETTIEDDTNRPVTAATRTTLALTRRWAVKAVDAASTATLEMTITAMRQEIVRPGPLDRDGKPTADRTVLDSATDEGRKQMAAFLNKPVLTAKVDARGRLVEAKAANGSADRLRAELPFRLTLPEQMPPVGGTWDRAFPIRLDPPFGTGETYDATQTYTLKGESQGHAVVGVATKLNAPPTDPAEMPGLLPLLWEGDVYFQKATGRYSGARLTVKKVVTNHQGEGTKFVYESQLTEGLAEK